MIWDKEHETMSRDAMRALQLERLRWTVGYAYENVPFYRERLDGIGLKPKHIKSLKDIEKIPFTTKDDLRKYYPFGLFAVPMSRIVRLHASSGTTGKPVVAGYTRSDMDMWTEVVARIVTMAGVVEGDVAQVSFGYGLFTGGFGLHYGLERVGATVVPASSGNSEKQIMLLEDFGATALISTPSYALRLAEIAEEMGKSKDRFKLRVGLFGGEGHSVGMSQEIENAWGITDTENYGMTEVCGPGVSGECPDKNGMHINEDHFYPEMIDPDTGETVGYGEAGELVLTTLTKEGIPMLRFRTKDITVLDETPCPCGRTTVRMERVHGRSDDMLIISGVNVFPSQIESVLMEIAGIGPHYEIVVYKKGYLDALEIRVELVDGSLLESFRELEALEERIRHRLYTVLGIHTKVRLMEPKTLARFEGKAKRVVDKREDREYKPEKDD
jgi:phenylacetate-CoA ligase